jgi:hypothetical protein
MLGPSIDRAIGGQNLQLRVYCHMTDRERGEQSSFSKEFEVTTEDVCAKATFGVPEPI